MDKQYKRYLNSALKNTKYFDMCLLTKRINDEIDVLTKSEMRKDI